jgi:hypothetical protein
MAAEVAAEVAANAVSAGLSSTSPLHLFHRNENGRVVELLGVIHEEVTNPDISHDITTYFRRHRDSELLQVWSTIQMCITMCPMGV